MSPTGAVTSTPSIAVVIPNWNGRRWLPECLRSLAQQTRPADEVIVVDNGSSDGSLAYLRDEHPNVRVLAHGTNTGFAYAANRGIEAAGGELVALINTDVVLSSDWLERMAGALQARPDAASAACKMLSLEQPGVVYDAGDVLRRDGACDQRGRFGADDGRFDAPGQVFGACAGAAVYRRDAVLHAGGFDERFFAYLEDVDLALRLRLRGWTCAYEPAVCWHAGEGSSDQLSGGHWPLVARNTIVLVVKAFPVRWLGFVAYRQLGWLWHARLERRLCAHVRGLLSAIPLMPHALRERRALRESATVPIEVVVPKISIRGAKRPARTPASTERAASHNKIER
ncbi:MAG TPA: glycosyltransferase family 2 protein [Solirubrobacteraceae bacterium]|nr:glycosyltransferase family 2 protein [Solirubrobacteraceae bacterium]